MITPKIAGIAKNCTGLKRPLFKCAFIVEKEPIKVKPKTIPAAVKTNNVPNHFFQEYLNCHNINLNKVLTPSQWKLANLQLWVW